MKIFIAVALVWAVYVLVASSDGAEDILDYLVLVYGSVFFAGTWLIATLYSLRRQARRQRYFTNPWTYVVPVVLLATLATLSTDAAFRLRFYLSKSELEQFARSFPDGAERFDVGWVGLFKIQSSDAKGEAVRMILGSCGFDKCGVVYSPNGEPPVIGEDFYFPMDGPWWFWHRSF